MAGTTARAALEEKREKYVCIKEGMMRNQLTGKVRMNFAASGKAQNPARGK